MDAGFRAEQAEASRRPEQLQAALPRGTALVDLLDYTAFQPPARGKGDFQCERRLVAFVVRPDRAIVESTSGQSRRSRSNRRVACPASSGGKHRARRAEQTRP